jgi:hypothetical protein
MRPAAKLKRNYVPGGPLYARRPLKFRGVSYRKGDALPVVEMTKVRHHRLWISGLANHEPHGPFDKVKAEKVTTAAPPAPASPPEVTVPAGAAALVEGVQVAESIDVLEQPSTPTPPGRTKHRR